MGLELEVPIHPYVPVNLPLLCILDARGSRRGRVPPRRLTQGFVQAGLIFNIAICCLFWTKARRRRSTVFLPPFRSAPFTGPVSKRGNALGPYLS